MEKRFVYLMKPVGHNVYKIGETINIEKRIERRQKKYAYKLTCVSYIETTKGLHWTIESKLHRMFEKYRIGNDWFVLPDPIVEQFVQIALEVADEIVLGKY